jgi:hypothetical protein
MGLALTPMGRLNFQPALRIGVDPAFFRQAAGEGQGVGTKLIGDLQLDFAVGRRGFDRLPEAIILFWAIKRHATPNLNFPSNSNAVQRGMFLIQGNYPIACPA